MLNRLAVLILALILCAPAIRAELLPPRTLGEMEQMGTGDTTLLLIPCMSCRWKSWEPFMQRNKENYTMFAVTLPGFGGGLIPDVEMNSGDALWHRNAVAALSDLIDREGLSDVIIVTNSFGGFIGIQLAAARPDVIRGMIDFDSSLTKPSKNPETFDARKQRAESIVRDRSEQFQDPEEWQRFNLVSSYFESKRRMLYHGWFMATKTEALLQYWRDNLFFDVEDTLAAVDMPILHVKSLSPAISDQEQARKDHLDSLSKAARRENVRTVFFYDTYHFVMEHRPEALDAIIQAFVDGLSLNDFHPKEAADD